MLIPVQITLRHMPSSEAVMARIFAEAAKLNRYYRRITSCRVLVEAPHRHHRKGFGFRIRIGLGVPREQLLIRHAPSLHRVPEGDTPKWAKHWEGGMRGKDINAAIRDAFDSARRRLEDYVRRLRGDVKSHTGIRAGTKLAP